MHVLTKNHNGSVRAGPIIALLGVLGLYSAILLPLEHPVAHDESLRHIALAALGTTQGWGDFFYHGYFAQLQSSDPWFLFHVLLQPIAHLNPLLIQHLIILITMTVLGLAFIDFCRSSKVPPTIIALLLCILLLGNIQFFLRSFLARPMFLQSALTVVALTALLHRRTITLFVVMALSTLLSHLFVIPLLLSLCAVLWHTSLKDYKQAVIVLGVSIGAVGLGIFLHPHTVSYVHYLITIFTKLPFLMQLDIGTEMMGGAGRDASLLALLAFTFFMIVIAQKKGGISMRTLHEKGISLLVIVVIVQFIAFYKWVRMVDFLWPLSIALIAQLIALQGDLPKKAFAELIPKAMQRKRMLMMVLVVILSTHVLKVSHTYWDTDEERSQTPIAAVMQQLPEDTNVLNIDWDLFPMLMYNRPDLKYARGMDPGFNFLVDKRSEKLFKTIDSTNDPEAWFDDALEIFDGTDVVVMWADRHPAILRYLHSNKRFKAIYPQTVIAVFLVQ